VCACMCVMERDIIVGFFSAPLISAFSMTHSSSMTYTLLHPCSVPECTQGRGRARPSVVSTALHFQSGDHGGGGRPGPPNASASRSEPLSTGRLEDESKHVGDVGVVDNSGAVNNGQHGREGAKDVHDGKGGEKEGGTKEQLGENEGGEGRRGRGAVGGRGGKERVFKKGNGNIVKDHGQHDLAASNEKEKEKEKEKESTAARQDTKAHDKGHMPGSSPVAPKPLAATKTTSGSAAATSNGVGGGALKGDDGVIADDEWNHMGKEARMASPSGKVTLTSVYRCLVPALLPPSV